MSSTSITDGLSTSLQVEERENMIASQRALSSPVHGSSLKLEPEDIFASQSVSSPFHGLSKLFSDIENLPSSLKRNSSFSPPSAGFYKKRFISVANPVLNSEGSLVVKCTKPDIVSPEGTEHTISEMGTPTPKSKANRLRVKGSSGGHSEEEIPVAGSDGSIWSMHTATSEARSVGKDQSEADANFDIKLDFLTFRRSLSHHLEAPLFGMLDIPTFVCTNLQNGKVFQSAVDAELYTFKRILYNIDPQQNLWRETNIYIGDFRDKCHDESSDEEFPILHRLGSHNVITSDDATAETDVPPRIYIPFKKGWELYTYRYGSFNDLQHEQRTLIDKALFMLTRYQEAIAARDLVAMMRLNDLMALLLDALNELCVVEYAIRELFYVDGTPQFILATSKNKKFYTL